jgi:hypothetical protein
MKPIRIDKVSINTRQIAESLWEEGGTQRLKTNRKGVSFYCCSGHGGYIVLEKHLKPEEIEKIKKYVIPQNINLLVQHREDGDYCIAISMYSFSQSCKSPRRFWHDPYKGKVKWVNMPVYTFEEDCEWCILEKFTDIKLNKYPITESERLECIENTFQTYFANKEK